MFKNKKLSQLDPCFMERFEFFAFESVVNEVEQILDEETQNFVILASLLGSQSKELFEDIVREALYKNISPVSIKELIYQGVDYLGMGKVYPFLMITNRVLKEQGIALPLEDQTTTSIETRLSKGIEIQKEIFGKQMETFWKQSVINKWLAENCFGDYYTRKGLTLKNRELITFCFLLAQGGCDSQLKSHVFGNISVGNNKEVLLNAVLLCVPYLGYPRSLNAIEAIESVTQKS